MSVFAFFSWKTIEKCKNWHFLKKWFFSFLIISQVIFDLQKRTIPQIEALNISFWPCLMHFTTRMDIWWAMKQRKCLVFSSSDFTFKFCWFMVIQAQIWNLHEKLWLTALWNQILFEMFQWYQYHFFISYTLSDFGKIWARSPSFSRGLQASFLHLWTFLLFLTFYGILFRLTNYFANICYPWCFTNKI